MTKMQAPYLSLCVAVLSALVVIAMFFFAVTDSKSAMIFLGVAVLFALSGAFWAYQFVKGRRL